MKRLKITSVLLSAAMCLSVFATHVSVMADETVAPSESQSTEAVESKETVAAKEKVKETEKKENEIEPPKVEDSEHSKEKETTSSETSVTDPTTETESTKPSEKESVESTTTEPSESVVKETDETKITETTVKESEIPSQSASTPKKNAVSGTCGEKLTWTYEDGMLTISGSGKMNDWSFEGSSAPWKAYRSEIRSVVLSEGITSIGHLAFLDCENLTSIKIPDSVTSIGWCAFSGCYSLASITIPESVTSIADEAFGGCGSLTSITIPNGITIIESETFIFCESLTSITIPNNVTSIGEGAFRGCIGLTSINIPKSVTSIEDEAFDGCSNLNDVYYDSNEDDWKKIKIGTGNNNLTKAIIHHEHNTSNSSLKCGDNLTWVYEDGTLTISGSGEMFGYTYDGGSNPVPWKDFKEEIRSIVLSGDITSIGVNAFSGCTKLTSVKIPNGLTEIGGFAFEYCSALTSITLPDSVTKMGKSAFAHCSSLKSIAIPNGVTVIEIRAFEDCTSLENVIFSNELWCFYVDAFSGCTSLTSISIPKNFGGFGDGAFDDCVNLKTVYFAGTKAEWDNVMIGSRNYCITHATIHCADIDFGMCGDNLTWSYEIKSNTLTISGSGKMYDYTDDNINKSSPAPWCVYRKIVSKVVISGDVTTIGNYAFVHGESLASITIPNSVKSIGDSAFTYCSNIKDVYYSGSKDDWGNIKIGKNNEVFNFANFHYGYVACGDKLSWNLEGSTLTISGSGEMTDWTSSTTVPWNDYRENISTVVLSGDITSIGAYAFSGCTKLTSVTIPNSVTSIGENAFNGCSGLKDIYYSGEKADWDKITKGSNNDALSDATNHTNNVLSGKCGNNLTWILDGSTLTISGTGKMTDWTLTTVPWNAYVDKISTVVFTGEITSIGIGSFKNCSLLTNISIPDSVTTIGESAFDGCSGITSITIPKGVTSIGTGAFQNCTGLTSVEIQDGITSIDDFVFNKCSNLTSITIPDSVTSIGSCAFQGCRSLTSITIPNSVTSIGGGAFGFCYKLKSITIPDSVTSLGNRVFNGCNGLTNITIPDGVSSLGEMFMCNCFSLTSITIPNSVTLIGNRAFEGCEGLKDVYFDGAKADWENITINTGNDALTKATCHYKCGEKLYWAFDGSALTISGSGEMNSWSSSAEVPWKDYSDNISSVVFSSDIASIGDYAFCDCSKITSITIPNSITSIGNSAFSGCSGLAEVYYSGTKADWNKINKGTNNDALTNASFPVTEKSDNPLSVKGKTAKVKYKKVKKKKQTVSRAKLMTVSGAQGKVTYKILSVNKKKSSFKINASTGAVTLKKKLKKGTYTLRVSVTAAGNDEYKSASKIVAFKIKVK